ncbi:MAG TPA: hypothetical protein VG326_07460 [Tepidisphaeraceae bacterium]|jgi:hypothetical protein|nr:hypothetical protein [Tepidisphaeraceae bacterium]
MKTRFLIAALLIMIGSTLRAAPAPSDQPAPPVLEPLKAKIGRHYAFKGTVLSFRAEAPITAEQWKSIEGLGIRLIVTGGKGIDDAAVERLAKLDPEGLILDGSALTDDGCKYIAEMKSLRWLNVGHTTLGKNGFSGAGFARLKSLPNLEKLGFGGTGAGDIAMDSIGELTQLKEFSSWHTHFTLESNIAFPKLIHLTTLTLGNSMPAWDGKPRRLSLTDATLPMIAQMTALEHLTLMQARFTLPGLKQLKALPRLKTLNLQNVEMTPAEVEKLRAELPAVKIDYKPLTEEDQKKLEDFLTHR